MSSYQAEYYYAILIHRAVLVIIDTPALWIQPCMAVPAVVLPGLPVRQEILQEGMVYT